MNMLSLNYATETKWKVEIDQNHDFLVSEIISIAVIMDYYF